MADKTNGPASPASPPKPGEIEPTRKPDDTPFKQQRLPAWQPVMSPPYVIGCFGVIAIAFVAIGAAIVSASDGVQEVDLRYDQFPCPWEDRQTVPYRCANRSINFEIQKTMKAPVFFYYKLENFFQNHRRYAKSRSATQLSGGEATSENQNDCKPFQSPGEYIELGVNKTVHFDNNSGAVNLEDVAYNPCGLVAWSMFNDSFILWKEGTVAGGGGSADELICNGANFDEVGDPLVPSQTHFCEKKGIVWPSDPGVRYSAPPAPNPGQLTYLGWQGATTSKNAGNVWAEFVQNGWYIGERGHKIPAAIDLDLMVWMRLASLSTFRKLYRRITRDLDKGSYRMDISQAFDVRSFSGKKSFVLSTSSWIGGKNMFLGGLYIAVGAICFILAVAFAGKHLTTPQRVSSL